MAVTHLGAHERHSNGSSQANRTGADDSTGQHLAGRILRPDINLVGVDRLERPVQVEMRKEGTSDEGPRRTKQSLWEAFTPASDHIP
jgi:hypothetical protein